MTTAAAVPSRVGRYEIVRRLGKSMTEVYLAIDTVDNRKAALKLIRSGNDTLTRMTLEAERRGAAIQRELHALDPRVVEIYEFGDADGYFFVAMQYVEGRSLSEAIGVESRLDPRRAAEVAAEICAQLAKFHAWQPEDGGPIRTVVHGDIKPSNVHLGPNGTVRLIDFGIAKTLRENRDATAHDFGSPSYCSPERLSRSQVDPHADLWAVGATLYEMIAGVPPYQAESTRKLESLIQSRRPPRALPPSCPRALRAIVVKALAYDAARRYRTAAEFHNDLRLFLDGQPTVAETERRSWSANGTIEVARAYIHRATRTLRLSSRPMKFGTAVAWFLAGMGLWIGGSYLWQARLPAKPPSTPPVKTAAAPAPSATEVLRAAYLGTARGVLDAYHNSVDPNLDDFDWRRAEACFDRAAELGATGGAVAGGLALARGYALLATSTPAGARSLFMEAALHMPRAPEPHLALARFYVYASPDLEQAMREFRNAELLGHRLGRREIEQQGDAYRLRAVREVAEAKRSRSRARRTWFWKHAAQDAAAARRLYERVPGYDKANLHLRELDSLLPQPRKVASWR